MKEIKDLNEVAQKKWNELSKMYDLDEVASDILYSLCQCYSRMIEAEKHMNDKGMLYKNPSGKIEASPMISISNNMQNQIKKHYDALRTKRKVEYL